MNIFFQRAFWSNLAGVCLVAVVATVPLMMSDIMDRGFEIAKQCVAEPLSILALGAVLLAGGWRRYWNSGTAVKCAAGAFVAFLLLAVVSTVLSENPEVAIFGGYYRREGLLAWMVYGAFFIAMLGWAYRSDRIENFLDVLLLASVVPAFYALQQRLDLDFFPVGARDLTRPGATMGSPLFLAAYLGVLLPITAVRCWQASQDLPRRFLWLLVAVLQLAGLLVTQTRGPLLAVAIGMLMLACFVAGYARARRGFHGAVVAFVVLVASLIAINTVTSARQWAQDVPVLGRLVFSLDSDAGEQTQRASSSAGARLGVWEAGNETFAAAPLVRKLLGYGPESAYMFYFRHQPASVVNLVGYGAYRTYDRMHADALDIGLNFGLLAWVVYCLFFALVMYAAARALFGLTGLAPACAFFAFMFVGASVSAIATVQIGLASAVVPAVGLGIGAGWLLFMVACAWRSQQRDIAATALEDSGNWALLAALTSSLLVFWVDAQVNIPAPTTRLISFGIAALILIVAERLVRKEREAADDEHSGERHLWMWGIACAMIALCASFVPIADFDAPRNVREEMHWLRRLAPLLVFLSVAAWAAWVRLRKAGATGGAYLLADLVGLPAIYVGIHLLVMVRPGPELNMGHALTISIACFSVSAFILALCLAYAVVTVRRARSGSDTVLRPAAALWMVAVGLSLALVMAHDWRATRADVASGLALEVTPKQSLLGEELTDEAIRLLPYERFYRRQLVFDLLGRALADIKKVNESKELDSEASGRIAAVIRNLALAETTARAAAPLFPRDPWVVVALANVLQVKALRIMRPIDPAGGLQAAQESSRLFALAHQIFPSEPLFLRNWAQLIADQGNLTEAYRILDEMERLVPGDREPYSERIALAMQASDSKEITDTLSRARARLSSQAYQELMHVAQMQH